VAGPDIKGVLGVFKHVDCCAAAIRALRDSGHKGIEAFSPVPAHEIQEALGLKPSPLGYVTLLGALFGLVGGISLAAYAASSFNIITGGKPLMAWIPWFVIGFESTILFGCLANFLAMLLSSGLLRWRLHPMYDERFSVDTFGIFVACRDGETEAIKKVLEERGAEEIYERS